MNAHSTPLHSDTLVLRVLEGRQAGAEYRLAQGLSVTIGHGFQHDIVLRIPAEKDISIRLDIGSAVMGLTVVAGKAMLLGRPLTAGDQAQLPLYVPLKIGGVCFAIGNLDSQRWTEAQQLGDTAGLPHKANEVDEAGEPLPAALAETPPAGIADQAQGVLQVMKHSLGPIGDAIAVERRWPIYAIVAATLLIAALLFNPISSWMGEQYFGASAAQQMVRDAGYRDITVSETTEGSLLFKGLVRDDAQLTQLRGLISEKQPNAVIDVTTLDGLAASVTDMLMAQGIDAKARPGRRKSLVIDSEYLPGDRQDELAAQIRKDMPLLGSVLFQINPKRGEPMLQYFFATKEYGIASFIDGDPAYIATANGDKWLKGATVPTGHVIIEIGNGRVRFERDGRIEELSFASSAADPQEDGAINNDNISETVPKEERKAL
jgi:hypothetical protein